MSPRHGQAATPGARTLAKSWHHSLRAEAMKLYSLPPVRLAAFATVALEGVVAKALAGGDSSMPHSQLLRSATAYALIGMIVLAVLAGASEFSAHQVERSLLAVPSRGRLLATKIAVLGGSFFAVAFLAGCVGVLVVSSGGTGLWRTGLACALFLTTMALFCAGVAFLLRDVVAALAACVVGLLVLPLVARSLPGSEWLPSELGQHLVDLALHTSHTGPHPLAAAAALVAWLITAWALAIARLMHGVLR